MKNPKAVELAKRYAELAEKSELLTKELQENDAELERTGEQLAAELA